MLKPLLDRFALLRNYATFITDIGYSRFFLIQFLGALAGLLTVLSLSSMFGILALFVTNTPQQLIEKLSEHGIAQRIPEFVKDHMLVSALFLAFLLLCFKLVVSVTYSYYSTLFLENYSKRIRRDILDRYFETYGLLDHEIKETEILYFNHQLLRFVSYYVAVLKANLEGYNSIFLFSFLMAISPTLSVASAFSLGLLFLATRPIHAFSKRMGKEYNHFVMLVEQVINRITRGIEILKTNNGKEREFQSLDVQNSKMVRKAMGMDIAEKLILIFPEMMSLVLILCVLSLQSHYDKSMLIAFLYSLLKLFGSLNNVNFLINNAFKLNSLPPEIHSYLNKWDGKALSENARGKSIGTIKSIHFENVRLNRNGTQIYAMDELRIEQGDRFQIFGPNGCGKSSLVKAFLGLMPYEGRILVNGAELSELDKRELFQRVSYLPQRFYLFNQSILENIQMGNDASLEEVEAMIQSLGIDSFIKGLKDGLDTVIFEDMKNLSGGQIQAISIARTLLKHADVYVLDEYGNNLDTGVKERVDKYLQTRLNDSILIMITHLPIDFVNKRLDFLRPKEYA